MSIQLHSDTQPVELSVEEWRFRQLLAAGWPEQQAVVLAAHLDLDLHLACDLLVNGCDRALAWEILA
jgi:hypothetical protein